MCVYNACCCNVKPRVFAARGTARTTYLYDFDSTYPSANILCDCPFCINFFFYPFVCRRRFFLFSYRQKKSCSLCRRNVESEQFYVFHPARKHNTQYANTVIRGVTRIGEIGFYRPGGLTRESNVFRTPGLMIRRHRDFDAVSKFMRHFDDRQNLLRNHKRSFQPRERFRL